MQTSKYRRPFTPPASSPVSARGRQSPARAVGSFVPRLTRKVFEKFGFSAAALITDWADIAGPELAAWCQPERLKWPRSPGSDNPDGDARRQAATLVLRVDPARALDIQYRQRQIIERINAYFGYRAVGDLRIVQAPLERTETPRQALSKVPKPAIEPSSDLATVADESLRAALARLQSNLTRA